MPRGTEFVGRSGDVFPGGQQLDLSQRVKVRFIRGIDIALALGFTPTGTGADTAEVPIPYDPSDGVTALRWYMRRVVFRAAVPGGAPAFKLQRSTGTGVFLPSDITTVTMPSGAYEVAVTGGFLNDPLNSGDKIRFNVTTLGTATGWTIVVELGSNP